MALMSMLIVAGGVGLCVGLGLLIAGIRGRRLDDHPVCRGCRFDLAGVFPGRKVCPECGASLGAARAVRKGNRRRRPRVLALGAVLLAIGVGATGGGVYSSAAGVNWNRYKPVWLLLVEARTSDAASAGAALKELSLRVTEDSLSQSRVKSLVEEATSRQADAKASWLGAWGDLVEAARTAGQVANEDWAAYIRRSATVRLVARARQRAGGVVHCEIELSPARCGTSEMTVADVEKGELRIGGARQDDAFPGGRVAFSPQATAGSFSGSVPVGELEPGRYVLEAAYEIGLGQGWGSEAPPVVVVKGEQSVEVELVGPDVELVKVIEDAAALEAVRGTIGVDPVKVTSAGMHWVHVTTNVWFGARDYAMAFDVFLRDESGREWPLSGMAMSAGIGKQGFGGGINIEGPFEAEEVDLVLRASPRRAEEEVGIAEILGGTIVVPGVKVMHQEGAPK